MARKSQLEYFKMTNKNLESDSKSCDSNIPCKGEIAGKTRTSEDAGPPHRPPNHVQKLETAVEREHFSDTYFKFRLGTVSSYLNVGTNENRNAFSTFIGFTFKWRKP